MDAHNLFRGQARKGHSDKGLSEDQYGKALPPAPNRYSKIGAGVVF